MKYNDFVEQYCEIYNIHLVKVKRLRGDYGSEIKVLAYLLRIKYRLSYSTIGMMLSITTNVAMYCYYEVLGSIWWREIAENKHKRVIDARDIQENE